MYKSKLSKKNKKVLFSLFFILAIIIITLGIRIYKNFSEKPKEQVNKEIHDYSPELANIQSKSFYVYDINEKKALFAKNEHDQLPLASITKLMSGLIITANLPSANTVTISESDIENGQGSNGLFVGEKWDTKDLLNFSLIMSSNSGIYALARTLNEYKGDNSSTTIELMNEKAKALLIADILPALPR